MISRRIATAVSSPEAMVVLGLTAMLGRHPDLVAVVGATGESVPDVVLYDVLSLERDRGVGLDHWIRQAETAVIAIGRDSRPDLHDRAQSAGVDGCIPLSIDGPALLAVLAAAVAGLPSALICDCRSERRQRLGAAVGLNAREAAILLWLAQGLSNGEIAERESLSINTIKSYLRSAYAKIGAHSRSQAVLWVLTERPRASAPSTVTPCWS
ncbi:hypothetical protein ASC77_23945 [Nocardioides sp. Root1257]|uniref:helix-turn-helix transcriptional regulator n=1 Tax=unclassified Nocardioides TaxID=2615069 RepID=UPI0006FC76A5|nr:MULTISPECIES: LuxR C-terminal-related transcriptional regulator [unclassified Nocardioides]KQW52444.1 hypothetical protein ASC77_23945 [Nocardioides sp. Root1257]KRC54507.1 hypothetical protein ASE24_23740 [Nocardioides sp. Root224]